MNRFRIEHNLLYISFGRKLSPTLRYSGDIILKKRHGDDAPESYLTIKMRLTNFQPIIYRDQAI